jgi:hypothetical protein
VILGCEGKRREREGVVRRLVIVKVMEWMGWSKQSVHTLQDKNMQYRTRTCSRCRRCQDAEDAKMPRCQDAKMQKMQTMHTRSR